MRLASLLVAVAACGAPSPPVVTPAAAPAPASAPDAAFQAIARDLATRTQRQVVGWGAADLGDVDHQVEYAVVVGDDRGAYLLAAGGQLHLVPFTTDGRTQVWGASAEPPATPAWVTDAARTVIAHQQGWHHGYRQTEFAIAGGAVVVRRVEHLEDGTVSQTPVVTPYGCAPACTPLAQVVDGGGLGAPAGPAPTLDALLVP